MKAKKLDDVLVYEKKSLRNAGRSSIAETASAPTIDDERSTVSAVYDEIVRMLTSWINYLDESDWKKRS